MAYKRNSPEPVVEGGSGVQSATAFSVLCGGATSVGAFQSVASVGTAGQVLSSQGAGALPTWVTPSYGYPTYTPVSSSPYVVAAGDQFLGVDTSSIAVTINLPNAPTTSRIFTIKDAAGSSATHNITVTTVGGSVTIDGATSYTVNTNYQSINLIFNGTSYEIY